MKKGLGTGALILAILAIFVPVVSLYVVWLSLVLVTISALMSDKIFVIATMLVNIVNVLFLSPMTLAALKGENLEGGSSFMVISLVLLVLPIITMIINMSISSKNNEGLVAKKEES